MTTNKLHKINRRVLAACMLEHNIGSIEELAKFVGVGCRTIYDGFDTGITIGTLVKIAKALGIKASELVTEEPEDAHD